MLLRFFLLITLSLGVGISPAFAERLSVAVASNFSGAMKPIAQAFEQHSGHALDVTYASSGKLYAQILNGAPYQVLLSADQKIPQQLVENGFALEESRFTYARGQLVLWSNVKSLKGGEKQQLFDRSFRRIALANAKLAPYGVAAVEVLDNLELGDFTQDKRVQGENIAQAFQFTATQNAELGFVALAQVRAYQQTRKNVSDGWLVPHGLYSPINQDAVVLSQGEDSRVAHAFIAFLKTDDIKRQIMEMGYLAVE